ncbi:MAG: hypothetical protein IKM55_00865 [Bacilli bacterium]|nr:hypothetical protein [Bacilli bacterium]
MNLWEELDACKFEDNEYLVDHLIEVVKDEELNTFEELEKYQEDYFKESGMTKEDWIKWYEKSFDKIPDLENIYGEAAANKINALRKELTSTKDVNKKIENIIKICVILEKECCFLVEIYNLIMGGEVTEEVTTEEVTPQETIVNPVDDIIRNQITEISDEEVKIDPNKNVVLCGSMKFKNEIVKISERLRGLGYNVLLPEECMRGEDKLIASRAHFNRIVDPNNGIILVVNATKNGIPNYIGPNTFAEIAFDFFHNKKVFLLNDIYHPYDDELLGWKVICLKGNLNKIKEG